MLDVSFGGFGGRGEDSEYEVEDEDEEYPEEEVEEEQVGHVPGGMGRVKDLQSVPHTCLNHYMISKGA